MIKKLALTASLISTGGCATYSGDGYQSGRDQTIFVRSVPGGVDVYQDDNYVGTTPGYMNIRRRQQPVLEFRPEGSAPRSVQLSSTFRWGKAFWGNLVFLTYAPIGWGIDWGTGAAFNVEDPPTQRFPDAKNKFPERKPQVVAIAPPLIDDEELSNSLGEVIAEKMKAETSLKILEYEDTAPHFQYFGANGEMPEKKEDRYEMVSSLKADHILFTRVTGQKGKYLVQGQLKDVVTAETDRTFAWDITPQDPKFKAQLSRQQMLSSYFRILPNTLFVNFSSYTPKIQDPTGEYKGKEHFGDSFEDAFFTKYIAAVNILSIRKPPLNSRGQWFFDFVPTLMFSHKNLDFPGWTAFRDADFQRTYAHVGYGIETGYMIKSGFAYIDVIPTVAWTKVSYSSPTANGSVEDTSGELMLELGYVHFVTDNFVVKIFSRSVSENEDAWSAALTRVRGQETNASTAQSSFSGFALGYYIPTSLKASKGWAVKAKRSR